MADTLRDLTNGTIGAPYRDPLHSGIGTVADLVKALAARLDQVGVTVPQGSPVLPGKSLTLKDLTVGDLGGVLENISYGMGPMQGGNYATGGIGTLGQVDPSVMELANALPFLGLAGKGMRRAGKVLTSKE